LLLAGAMLYAGAPLATAAPPGTTVPPPGTTVAGTVPPDTTPPDTAPLEEGGSTEGGLGTSGGETAPPQTLPLIPVPTGCTPPTPAHVVFLGTVIGRDFRSIRYRVDQVRAGSTAPFAAADQAGDEIIDVRYGLDTQYLADGQQYLVGAVVDPDLGLLVSRVKPVAENFGGDEVIGVSETDVDCPEFENPMRTLHPDGTVVEGSMLEPFFSAKWRIAAAFLAPLGVVFAALFVLSMLRLSATGAYNGLLNGRGRQFS